MKVWKLFWCLWLVAQTQSCFKTSSLEQRFIRRMEYNCFKTPSRHLGRHQHLYRGVSCLLHVTINLLGNRNRRSLEVTTDQFPQNIPFPIEMSDDQFNKLVDDEPAHVSVLVQGYQNQVFSATVLSVTTNSPLVKLVKREITQHVDVEMEDECYPSTHCDYDAFFQTENEDKHVRIRRSPQRGSPGRSSARQPTRQQKTTQETTTTKRPAVTISSPPHSTTSTPKTSTTSTPRPSTTSAPHSSTTSTPRPSTSSTSPSTPIKSIHPNATSTLKPETMASYNTTKMNSTSQLNPKMSTQNTTANINDKPGSDFSTSVPNGATLLESSEEKENIESAAAPLLDQSIRQKDLHPSNDPFIANATSTPPINLRENGTSLVTTKDGKKIPVSIPNIPMSIPTIGPNLMNLILAICGGVTCIGGAIATYFLKCYRCCYAGPNRRGLDGLNEQYNAGT